MKSKPLNLSGVTLGLRNLMTVGIAVGLAASAHSQTFKVAQSSGDWNVIAWDPAGTPAAAEIANIEGGFTVDYSSGVSPTLNRVYVGNIQGLLPSADGTLEVSGGSLNVNRNDASAISAGRSANSVGTINVTGGALNGGFGSVITGLQLGVGASSTGSFSISAGSLSLTSGVVVGAGSGAAGDFTVTGGTVSVSTLSTGGPFNIGNRSAVSTTGSYLQTGGSVTVPNNYFGVGYAGASTHLPTAIAEISGGTFSANVRVGREAAVLTGGGTGTLTIGSAADISGRDQAWLVSGTGELIFELGTTDAFNAVDLTLATSSALNFTQAGALITIDGSSLIFSEDYITPITLIEYDGLDSILGLGNVTFAFTGFDPGFDPSLTFTETGLELTVIPEPSTIALMTASLVLGLAVLRRRRRSAQAA